MKNTFLPLLLIAVLALYSCSNKKAGYINIQTVFNGFDYKKELEKEVTSLKNSRRFILDSMETNLTVLAKKIGNDKADKNLAATFKTMRQLYLEKKEKFEQEEEMLVKQYDEKIFNQINSYVKEFGKEKKMSFLYGATANGNIMYADTSMDLTKEVLIYINAKFHGKH